MELRPYQKEDAQKLIKFPGTGCFNEQRTGKTPTALETIRLRNLINEKVLIIATVSSLYQWQEEYIKWLSVPCVVCDGTQKHRINVITNQWTNGMVISLDSIKTTKRTEGMVTAILNQNPKCVILDEAHKIKTPSTAAAKSAFKLTKIPYRIALTGTPAPGRAIDIYSILRFLRPSEYGSEYAFKNTYFKPEKKGMWTPKGYKEWYEYNNFRLGMETVLQKTLEEFTTQRKRKEVMPWLPEKDYTKVRLEPTAIQKKEIKNLHEIFKIGDIETKNTLEALIRERQLCLDPELLGIKGKSPKTEWIKQYIKDYPEKPIIIFSKFTSYLKKLYLDLKDNNKLAMIIGQTPQKTREIYKKDFQNGLFNILLINIDAGKEALTLDRAEVAIFMDKYPPIGDLQQAEDRFIATTEDKKEKPHQIIELMIHGTYDERIYNLLEARYNETEIINNYNKYLKKGE